MVNPLFKLSLFLTGNPRGKSGNRVCRFDNEEERERLKLIVNIIKRNTLPRYGDGSKLYLKYPSTVDIFLIGVDEDSFAKYKTCMIRSFTVNPTAQNGLTLLRGGRPSSVTIDMNLMESDIHTAEDYEGGTYA